MARMVCDVPASPAASGIDWARIGAYRSNVIMFYPLVCASLRTIAIPLLEKKRPAALRLKRDGLRAGAAGLIQPCLTIAISTSTEIPPSTGVHYTHRTRVPDALRTRFGLACTTTDQCAILWLRQCLVVRDGEENPFLCHLELLTGNPNRRCCIKLSKFPPPRPPHKKQRWTENPPPVFGPPSVQPPPELGRAHCLPPHRSG